MNTIEKPKYSVIVPVYNGSLNLEELFSRTKTVFEKYSFQFEMIFVDDHSRDNSWEIIKSIKEKNPSQVTGIRLTKNFGQQNATMCGFFQAKGDFIITIDDDLDFSPEDILLLIDNFRTTDSDLIYGSTHYNGFSFRNIFSNAYKGFSKIEGSKKGRGSSLRLMTRKLVENIMQNANNFVFIDEICLWYTDNISFVEVKKPVSKKKKSRYTLKGLFRLAGDQIIFSSTFPLKLMTWFGTVVAIVNFLFGLKFIFRKLVHNAPLGYTSVIVSILFSTGIILICIGVIGTYLGRVLRVSNKVPSFCIEQKV